MWRAHTRLIKSPVEHEQTAESQGQSRHTVEEGFSVFLIVGDAVL